MYELTTPEGIARATTVIELASAWAALEHGPNWDADCGPFDEHTTVWAYVEALDELRERPTAGYELRELRPA